MSPRKLRRRSGSWILFATIIGSFFSPTANALNEQGDTVIFSYDQSVIYQEVSVNTSGKNSITASVRASETQFGTDSVLVGIGLYGDGGGGIYFHDTGWVAISSSGYSNISISVDAESVGPGWGDVKTARITIGGDDGEFWAGNYGPTLESASLKIDGSETLSNGEFSKGTQGWTSSVGWQTCHATSGDKPCSSLESRINNSPYSLGPDMVWATANEGWDLSLSAPGGGTFTKVVFASYGTPSGSGGTYSQGSCHATNSILKVAQSFIGSTSGTIGASNGIFGDPCGGTYKRLNIVLQYEGGVANTTTTSTTTTTLPPSCGPYENITVTGKNNGSVWGSGPYTDDSDFGVAAVHAGLISVGETAVLVPSNIAYHSSYPGSTSNGVTTSDWLSGWCGYDISLFTAPTSTTTTSSSTTTTSISISSTTTTIVEPETTTTIAEPEVTVPPEIPSTTTEPEPTTTTVVEPDITPPDTIDTSTTQPEEPDGAESTPGTETTVPEPAPDTQNEAPQDANNEVVEVTTENLDEVLSGEITEEVVDAVVDAITSGEIEITEEVADQLVDVITSGEATEEQIVAAVEALIESGNIDTEAAVELVTSPEVLEAITAEEATELFDSIDTEVLSEEQKSEMSDVLSNADDSVKEAFEEEIDIYGDGFDTYVPQGSAVDVQTRRAVLAAGVVLSTSVIAAAPPSSPSGPSQPSSGGSGGGGGGPSGGSEGNESSSKRRRGWRK